MKALAAFYAVGAIVFFLFPAELIYLINVGPKVFKLTQAIADPADRYWTVLASAGMATLSALCLFSAESPEVRGYKLIHLLAKVVTLAGFLTMYVNDKHYFAYVLGIPTELAILTLLLWKGSAVKWSMP